MERIGLRIKKLREVKKISQLDLSRKLSVTQSSISRYESCNGDPDSAFLTKLCSTYSVNLNWLLTGEGIMFQEFQALDPAILGETIRLPIVAEIAAGSPAEGELYEPWDYVEIPRALLKFPPPYLVFRVAGRSMEPHILQGDIVVCSEDWRGIKTDGKIMAFRTWEGITLKKLVDDRKNRVTWLMPINHEFTPQPYTQDGEALTLIGILDIAIRSFNRA